MSDKVIDSVSKGFYAFKSINPKMFKATFPNEKKAKDRIKAWSYISSIAKMDSDTFYKKMVICAREGKFFPFVGEVLVAGEFKDPPKNEIETAFTDLSSDIDGIENKVYKEILIKSGILESSMRNRYDKKTMLPIFSVAYIKHFKDEYYIKQRDSISDKPIKLEDSLGS